MLIWQPHVERISRVRRIVRIVNKTMAGRITQTITKIPTVMVDEYPSLLPNIVHAA